MKKKIIMFFLILLSIFIIRYKYDCYKCKDINYVTKNYLTTGLFYNKNKLCKIYNSEIKFSDGKTAVIQVEGLSKNSPHIKTIYNLFLEKDPNQVWRIKKVYKNTK